jgi:hypothetical protein
VDHKHEAVLLPIYGVIVPFHITTIKTASIIRTLANRHLPAASCGLSTSPCTSRLVLFSPQPPQLRGMLHEGTAAACCHRWRPCWPAPACITPTRA